MTTKLRRAFLPTLVVLALILMMTGQTYATRWRCGCTPGFWKNHQSEWQQTWFVSEVGEMLPPAFTGPLTPSTPLGSIFDIPPALSWMADDTLLQALRYTGGSGISGGARILLRAAVAALLNSTHVGLRAVDSECGGYFGYYTWRCEPEIDPATGEKIWDYDCMAQNLVAAVSAALRSGSRDLMLSIGYKIDTDNNMICPLGGAAN